MTTATIKTLAEMTIDELTSLKGDVDTKFNETQRLMREPIPTAAWMAAGEGAGQLRKFRAAIDDELARHGA